MCSWHWHIVKVATRGWPDMTRGSYSCGDDVLAEMSHADEHIQRALLSAVAEPGDVTIARLLNEVGVLGTIEHIARPDLDPALHARLYQRLLNADPRRDLDLLAKLNGRVIIPSDDLSRSSGRGHVPHMAIGLPVNSPQSSPGSAGALFPEGHLGSIPQPTAAHWPLVGGPLPYLPAGLMFHIHREMNRCLSGSPSKAS